MAAPTAQEDLFKHFVIDPIRGMASTTIDVGAVLGGLFLPGMAADHVAEKYDDLLFHEATL
jgi:NTE family protein